MPLGGIGKALSGIATSALGSFATGLASNIANPAVPAGGLSAHDAFVANANFTRELRRYDNEEAPAARVRGLRKAGLNPILAAGNAFNASQGPAPTAATPDRAATAAARAQLKLASVSSAKVAAETDLIKAKANTERTQAGVNVSQKFLNEAKVKTEKALGFKFDQEGIRAYEQAASEIKRQNNLVASTEELNARANYLRANTKLNEQQLRHLITEYPGLLLEQKIDLDSEELSTLARKMRRFGSVSNAAAAGAAGAAVLGVKKLINGLQGVRINPKTTGTFSKKTGEIFNK